MLQVRLEARSPAGRRQSGFVLESQMEGRVLKRVQWRCFLRQALLVSSGSSIASFLDSELTLTQGPVLRLWVAV